MGFEIAVLRLPALCSFLEKWDLLIETAEKSVHLVLLSSFAMEENL